ncbi:MAG: DUF4234 domain-containing protein [Deltaproteobacteria bacterium]|nr:DUF4234 domain-containing protein [Deltaproteobacteria bacterium]
MQRRDLVTAILLTVVTCGIYSLFWMFQMGNDIATLRGDDQPKPTTDLVLTLITCGLWYFVVSYRWAQLLNEVAEQRGKRVDSNFPVLCLVLAFFSYGIVGLALMQNTLNDLIDA